MEGAQKIWENLGRNNLWKRMIKNVIATTAAVGICLVPGARDALGRAAYLAPITTVFGHPGRRFGMMAESLILALGGTVVGVAWSLFGIYLGGLAIQSNSPAALFLCVLLLIIVSVVLLTSPAQQVTGPLATQILYPILMAAGVILLVNISIFPEFSSAFMGQITIETLNEIADTLRDAGRYFVQEGQGPSTPPVTGQTQGLQGQAYNGGSIDHEDDYGAQIQDTGEATVENKGATEAKRTSPYL
ncbi:MAG: hypothetical protein M1830_000282 [Pleopsidium flavum]|nr:MAG: hypothetical protein M1830_000282 [Pleopsidium flavum]